MVKKKRRKNTTSSHFRISKMKSLLLIVLLTLTSSSIGDALLRRKKGKKTMLASASVGARESKEKAPTTWGGGSVRCIFHNLFNTFGICIHIYIYINTVALYLIRHLLLRILTQAISHTNITTQTTGRENILRSGAGRRER
jgi:hypothetical protein